MSPATPRLQSVRPRDPARPANIGWPETSRATNDASATACDGSRGSALPAVSIAARSDPLAAPVAGPPTPRRTPSGPGTAPRAESPDDGSLPPHSRNSLAGRKSGPGSPARRAAYADTEHCEACHRMGNPRPEPLLPDPHQSVRAARRNSHPQATSGTRDCLLSSCGNHERRRALQRPCQALGGSVFAIPKWGEPPGPLAIGEGRLPRDDAGPCRAARGRLRRDDVDLVDRQEQADPPSAGMTAPVPITLADGRSLATSQRSTNPRGYAIDYQAQAQTFRQ